MRIRDLLTRPGLELTPSETKIAAALLTDYPIAGLGTATSLAKRAAVSDPTVIRLVMKIGFDGFAAFQARLLEEVEAGLRSPLMMMEAKRTVAGDRNVVKAYLDSVTSVVEEAARSTLPQNYARAVELIMDAKGSVLLVGGRFSRHVAAMFAAYLSQFRPDIVSVAPLTAESCDSLLDLDGRDTLVVFDYRRYQTDVIRFAEQAAARGVQLVLFTDAWRSPIAAKAKVVIVSPVEVASPYDSLAAVVAQIEALVASIVARQTRTTRARVQELDRVRDMNAVTLESTDAPSPVTKLKSAGQRKVRSRRRK